jgi:ankyrin repeat protein
MRMFRFLIDAGAGQKGIVATLLEVSSRKGQQEFVASLLDIGYNVNIRLPSLSVTKYAHVKARWLLGAVNEGLHTDSEVWSMTFRDVGEQQTVLTLAATYGYKEAIELSLDRGAFINNATTKGFTILRAASYQSHTEFVEVLVHHEATVMLQMRE